MYKKRPVQTRGCFVRKANLSKLTLSDVQAMQQQSPSETVERGNTANGSSDGDDGDSVQEEEGKKKVKEDKTGSKRKKTASSKV